MDPAGRLTLRYCALFGAHTETERQYGEFCLSAASVKHFLAPYVDLSIVLYTLPEYAESVQRVLNQLDLRHEIELLDNVEDAQFADSIEHCQPIDRICIRRMLQDFRALDDDSFRLLMGTDCFLLGVPDEVISFTWNPRRERMVLYAQDVTTFGGVPYKLRYWRGRLLDGLLNDFYCLGPGVTLQPDAIRKCLRLIDRWPPTGRFDPPYDGPVHACEQMAAAMMLAQYNSEPLRPDRYSHMSISLDTVMVHTHDLDELSPCVPDELGVCSANSSRRSSPAERYVPRGALRHHSIV